MTRSRNRRLRLIPSHLPLIRDKLAEYERVALKEEMAAHSQYERSMEAAWNFADNLAVAQLWWISRDMTALAEDTVRAGDFPKSEAPAQSGLIFFDGDVQMVRFPVTDDATGRKVEDCHLNDGRPWVRFDRKGDWSQRVSIPSDAAEALARLIGERRRGAVFREDSGARLRQQTAVGIVSSVALRVGVPDISPHSLRRTFCTLSRDAGVPDRDIMAAGGWNSPQMLDYYDMARRGLDGRAGDGLQRFLNNG